MATERQIPKTTGKNCFAGNKWLCGGQGLEQIAQGKTRRGTVCGRRSTPTTKYPSVRLSFNNGCKQDKRVVPHCTCDNLLRLIASRELERCKRFSRAPHTNILRSRYIFRPSSVSRVLDEPTWLHTRGFVSKRPNVFVQQRTHHRRGRRYCPKRKM